MVWYSDLGGWFSIRDHETHYHILMALNLFMTGLLLKNRLFIFAI